MIARNASKAPFPADKYYGKMIEQVTGLTRRFCGKVSAPTVPLENCRYILPERCCVGNVSLKLRKAVWYKNCQDSSREGSTSSNRHEHSIEWRMTKLKKWKWLIEDGKILKMQKSSNGATL